MSSIGAPKAEREGPDHEQRLGSGEAINSLET